VIEEVFSQGETFLHRADPRAKIVGAAALTLAVALAQGFAAALLGLGLGAVLAAASRPGGGKLAARLLAVNGFILFLWAALPLTMPGQEIARLGPLVVSQEGVRIAALVTVKCNAIVLMLVALVATSTVPDLGRAMLRLKVPAKLCFLLLFCYRYLDVMACEYKRLARAAKARCFEPRTNLHTYRSYAHLVGMVLIRSLDRSKRVYQAMILRGFDGRFHSLAVRKAGGADILLGAGLVLSACALAWIETVY